METKILKSSFIILGLLFLFIPSALAQESSILFDNKIYDYGTIEFGKKAKSSLRFKNTGNTPVIIKKVMTSCGCVVLKFDKKPVKPNATNEIDVIFHAVERVPFNKTVMVFVSDQKKPIVLNVKGKSAVGICKEAPFFL